MLAGFDGYSHDVNENYADASLELITRNAVLDAMNIGMTEILKQYSQKVKITFDNSKACNDLDNRRPAMKSQP